MLTSLLYFALIGLLAGSIAGFLVRGGRGGILYSMIIGILGAFFGGFLFRLVGLSAYGLIGELITATAGAMLLILLLRRTA